MTRYDLVVGVGTERGDDAAGLLVARRLRAAAKTRSEPAVRPGQFPAGPIRVAELSGDLTRLLDLWRPADRVAVVDAVRAAAPAGTILILDATAAPIPAGVACGSTHGLGIGDAVELARSLGRLPARLVVYGIAGQRWDERTPPGPEVDATADRLVGLLAAG